MAPLAGAVRWLGMLNDANEEFALLGGGGPRAVPFSSFYNDALSRGGDDDRDDDGGGAGGGRNYVLEDDYARWLDERRCVCDEWIGLRRVMTNGAGDSDRRRVHP